MQDLRDDKKLKSPAQLAKELGKTCRLCTHPLTQFQGLGSVSLCRQHQTELIEYGGYGRLDRPNTFYRADICSCCGQDVNLDPRWIKAQEYFGVILNEEEKHEIKRRYNHGDHSVIRKADGGSNSADNIEAMCTFCHWVKTVINNDGRKGSQSLAIELENPARSAAR